MRVFTLGYQGLSLDAYTDLLVASGAGVVLDVREVPWSRKPGFSKGPLAAGLAAVGIDYVHLRSAGNPSRLRREAASAAECLRRYDDYLRENLDAVAELLEHVVRADAAKRPACLTCLERDPRDCHRSVLARYLVEAEPRLVVEHLTPDPQQPLPLAG